MALKSSNKVDTNVYEIEVTVTPEVFTDACKSAYMKQRKSIQLPGFRKGKATQGMIEKVYGENAFYEEALEIVYPEAVTAAIEEAGLRTVDTPFDLDVPVMSKEQGVEMKMKVTVYPEVKLGDYKGLKATMLPTEATDEDVDKEIENMRDRNSRLVTVEDREAQMGDTAEIDFEGFVDGVAFEGGKGENYPLELGSGSFIPGFEEQVAGHKSDEEFDVNVTFPEDYAAELAGKDAVFKCKIHEIKSKELPELDDEFAKDVSEFDTLDELKADIKKQMNERKAEEAKNDFENQLIEQVIDNMECEVPQCMFDKRADEITLTDFKCRVLTLIHTLNTSDRIRMHLRQHLKTALKSRLRLLLHLRLLLKLKSLKQPKKKSMLKSLSLPSSIKWKQTRLRRLFLLTKLLLMLRQRKQSTLLLIQQLRNNLICFNSARLLQRAVLYY